MSAALQPFGSALLIYAEQDCGSYGGSCRFINMRRKVSKTLLVGKTHRDLTTPACNTTAICHM